MVKRQIAVRVDAAWGQPFGPEAFYGVGRSVQVTFLKHQAQRTRADVLKERCEQMFAWTKSEVDRREPRPVNSAPRRSSLAGSVSAAGGARAWRGGVCRTRDLQRMVGVRSSRDGWASRSSFAWSMPPRRSLVVLLPTGVLGAFIYGLMVLYPHPAPLVARGGDPVADRPLHGLHGLPAVRDAQLFGSRCRSFSASLFFLAELIIYLKALSANLQMFWPKDRQRGGGRGFRNR